jgi:hypothetical protein
MYKNNSGLIAKTKVSKYKKGLCLTGKLVYFNQLYEVSMKKRDCFMVVLLFDGL